MILDNDSGLNFENEVILDKDVKWLIKVKADSLEVLLMRTFFLSPLMQTGYCCILTVLFLESETSSEEMDKDKAGQAGQASVEEHYMTIMQEEQFGE